MRAVLAEPFLGPLPTPAGRCPLFRDGPLPLLGAIGSRVSSVQSSVF